MTTSSEQHGDYTVIYDSHALAKMKATEESWQKTKAEFLLTAITLLVAFIMAAVGVYFFARR